MTKFFKDSEILDYFYEALEDENISFEYYNITQLTLSNFLTGDFITLDEADIMMNFINDYFYNKYENFEPFRFEELYDVDYLKGKSLRGGISKISNNLDLSFEINANSGMRVNRKGNLINSFKSVGELKTEKYLNDLYQKIILNNKTLPLNEELNLPDKFDIDEMILSKIIKYYD